MPHHRVAKPASEDALVWYTGQQGRWAGDRCPRAASVSQDLAVGPSRPTSEEQVQGSGFWNRQRRSHRPGQGTVGDSKTKGTIVLPARR